MMYMSTTEMKVTMCDGGDGRMWYGIPPQIRVEKRKIRDWNGIQKFDQHPSWSDEILKGNGCGEA